MSRFYRYVLASIAILIATLVSLHLNPRPLFSFKTEYKQFTIWSDQHIENGWDDVINDAVSRLSTSELYNKEMRFRIYVCNDSWRLWLFTRNASVGGFADTFTTRNIFLREVKASKNQLVPPRGVLADAQSRPLSYFIAHEATHAMQSKEFGRLFSIRSPKWLVEGYADYVAKAGDFDFEKNRQLLRDGNKIMSEKSAKNGLYRRYHLMTEQVIFDSKKSIKDIYASPPDAADILSDLLNASE